MYHSITFYDGTERFNTYDDWFLVPEKRPLFAAPVPKTKYLDIPGADGQIDLTESLTGYPVFNNREGTWTFYVLNDHGEWFDRYSEIMAKIQGRLLKAVLEDEPQYYYRGRFYLSEWSSEPSYSKVTINYKVEPYKWAFEEDHIQISELGGTIINNPTHFPVRPIIEVVNPTSGANVRIKEMTMTCSEGYQGVVTIDCERMNIYSGSTNLNSKWSGKFPELKSGNNKTLFFGCDSMKVVVNWRSL